MKKEYTNIVCFSKADGFSFPHGHLRKKTIRGA